MAATIIVSTRNNFLQEIGGDTGHVCSPRAVPPVLSVVTRPSAAGAEVPWEDVADAGRAGCCRGRLDHVCDVAHHAPSL